MFVVFVFNSISRYLFLKISSVSQRNSFSSFLISCLKFPMRFTKIWKSPCDLVLISNESDVSSVERKSEQPAREQTQEMCLHNSFHR